MKKRIISTLATSYFLLASAAVAVAEVAQHAEEHGTDAHAHGGGHESEWNSFFWTLLTFAIYCTILAVVYRKKIAPVIRKRSEVIREFLGRAGAEMARVQAELSQIQEQISELPEEAREIEKQYREEGEQIARSLKTQSEEESQRILQEVVNQRESSLSRLGQELQAELVERAVKLAEERIKKTLSPEDDRRVRNEALTSLAR